MLSRFRQDRGTGQGLLRGGFGLLVGGVLSAALIAGNGGSGKPFADPLETAAPQRSAVASRPFQAMALAGERLVAVGQRGLVATSEDGGVTWEQRPIPVQVDLVAVDFVDDLYGWASGHDGVLLGTQDGGLTWQRQFDGREGPALADHYRQQTDTVADAEMLAGQIERNFGQGPWLPMLDVHFSSRSTGFALGSFGMLLSSEDGGDSWQPALHRIDNPDYLHLNAMETVGAATLIASERGTIFRREGEAVFQPVATGHGGTFFSLASHGDTVLAGGLRGVVYLSRDAGRSWQSVTSGLTQTVSAIRWLPSRQSFVLVTIGGEVARTDLDATHFSAVHGFQPGIHTSVIAMGPSLIVGGMQGLQRSGESDKATGAQP